MAGVGLEVLGSAARGFVVTSMASGKEAAFVEIWWLSSVADDFPFVDFDSSLRLEVFSGPSGRLEDDIGKDCRLPSLLLLET